jgi:hypothetical protein
MEVRALLRYVADTLHGMFLVDGSGPKRVVGVHMPTSIRYGVVLMALAGCISTPGKGTEPHAMSAAEHEAMAARDEHAATLHREGLLLPCSPWPAPEDVCWTSRAHTTKAHQAAAEAYTRSAAAHRAASQALRDAEAKECAGLSALDRDMGPFVHREDIVAVERLEGGGTDKLPSHLQGAAVVFRAVPGMTVQWLQRQVICHQARMAVIGHDAAEMRSCPLAPRNVTAVVTARPTGFAIEMRSDDPETAREILQRAGRLVQTKPL